MPVVPTLMVLYTNDAVEVRYSDGSRLQLSPCGSSMLHQDPPSEDLGHPLAGAQGVQKWTQFVTSAHKAKVIQALDFRNRFSHRPFLCSSLIPPEDIVSLYAKIDKIAWPKTPKDANIEVFGDGSRRAVSSDEYASLVLSPHGQDFTVCYLSHISGDARESQNQSEPEQFGSDQNCDRDEVSSMKDLMFGDVSQQHHTQSCRASDEKNADDPRNITPENEQRIHDPGHQYQNVAALNINCNSNIPGSGVAEVTMDASGVILSDGTISTPGRTAQQGDLQTSAVCSMHHDISSISRVSTPDGLRGMVDCDVTLLQSEEAAAKPPPPSGPFLHSSPLSIANTQSLTGQGNSCMAGEDAGEKVSSERENGGATVRETTLQGLLPGARTSSPREDCTIKSACSGENHSGTGQSSGLSEGSCGAEGDAAAQLKSSSHSPNSDEACQILPSSKEETSNGRADNQVPFDNKASPPQPIPQTQSRQMHMDPKELHAHFSKGSGKQVRGKGARRRGDGLGGGIAETWSATRQHYTWVTQHISCSDCPAAWRHPLRMLQLVDPTDSMLVSECNLTVSSNVAKGLQATCAVDADQSVYSSVAVPLPLSCPFQHLHAWQPYDHDDEIQGQGLSEFKQGQFHVIMMEGVVYRFVQLGNMKVVEIYPGDSSVFVSQGITAHFFSHIVWKDGKLEEKTYSVKMLPPNVPKSPYSIEKLIKRGHRFLTGCMHNTTLSDKEELPCWKRAPMQVVEPLSTSVLEECSVPGYGRFTAYSNGRIRVVFEDRTALDMVADFSQRLQGCLKHSDYTQHSTAEALAGLKVTSFDQQLSSHRCRLLLPTGKYIIVEVHKPGVYRRYVDAAKEWINWVQSSPAERRQFYQQKAAHQTAHRSAEAELKKIECFNYIVDHAGITNINASQDSPEVSPPSHLRQAVLQQAPYNLQSGSSTHYLSHVPSAQVGQHSMRYQPVTQVSHDLQYSTRYQTVPQVPQARHYQTAVQGFDLQGGSTHHRQMHAGIPSMSDPKGLELAQGFNSVREALLRTSQMIKDIDDIVKEHKKTK